MACDRRHVALVGWHAICDRRWHVAAQMHIRPCTDKHKALRYAIEGATLLGDMPHKVSRHKVSRAFKVSRASSKKEDMKERGHACPKP